jgi:nucleotide-binding universal stress UspA family protein
MYEKILVPLDASDLAEKVLPYVRELASKFASEVRLVTVVPPTATVLAAYPGGMLTYPAAEVTIDELEESQEAAEENISAYLESVAKRFEPDGLRTQIDIIEGDPADSLIDYAKQNGVSLIAISTHGRGGIGRAVFGSVADDLIRKSSVPVLVIRVDEEAKSNS